MVDLFGDLTNLGDPSDVALSPTLISVLKIWDYTLVMFLLFFYGDLCS